MGHLVLFADPNVARMQCGRLSLAKEKFFSLVHLANAESTKCNLRRSKKITLAANRMQRIFQLRSSEKSFVSRISPRNPCLPAIVVIFCDIEIIAFQTKEKNFEKQLLNAVLIAV